MKLNDEIQSRREFFKSAAKKALPILGTVALMSMPNIVKSNAVTSQISSDVCEGCTGLCTGCTGCTSCSGWCEGSCTGCTGSCTGCTGCAINCYGNQR